MPSLRQQIADSLYPTLNLNNILFFAGAEEGVFCALSTLCTAEDNVIVLTPCYQSFVEVPKLAGAEVRLVPLQESNDWRIDLEAIKKVIDQNTKCLVINFSHNPSGQIITQNELSELINLLDLHGIWLFSDEVYRLLGTTDNWSKPAAEIYPRALSLGVMSKAFGVAGLRVGWIACQDQKIIATN